MTRRGKKSAAEQIIRIRRELRLLERKRRPAPISSENVS